MFEFRSKRFFVLFSLLFLFVLTQWSSSIYLPIAPKLANVFNGHGRLVASSLSLFFIGYALGQIFWGILSDFIGRYTALISSLSAYLIIQILISFSGMNAVSFVIFLALAGFTISANTSVGNALIKDYYQEKAKSVISYVGIAMACAPVVAPLIGTSLYSRFGWKAIFIFLLAAGILSLALFSVYFKKTVNPNHNLNHENNGKKGSPILCMIKEALSDTQFVSYIVILALSFGIFFSLLLVIPFILENMNNFSVDKTGFIIFGVTITYIIGALGNSFFIRRVPPSSIVKLGLILIFVGSAFFLLNTFFIYGLESFLSLISVAIGMLGIGAILPAAKAGAMMRATKNAGTYSSVMKFVQTLGCVLLTKTASFFIASHNISYFLVGITFVSAFIFVFGLVTLRN